MVPRFVRPSWVDVTINGDKKFGTGPARLEEGTLNVYIKVRSEGEVCKLLHIESTSRQGKISTRVMEYVAPNANEAIERLHYVTNW